MNYRFLKAARRGCTALAGLWLVVALTACGGGGGADDDDPTFQVNVSTSDSSTGPQVLSAGTSAAQSVASGTQITITSNVDARWTVNATDSAYVVNEFSLREKLLTLSSAKGGTVVIVLTSDNTPAESATLTVTVGRAEFTPILPRVGEIRNWHQNYLNYDGTTYSRTLETRVSAVEADGAFTIERFLAGRTVVESDYDSDGRTIELRNLTSGEVCKTAYSQAQDKFPLFVSKTWSIDSTETCSSGYTSSTSTKFVVESLEKVSVSLGELDALRIQSTSTTTSTEAGGMSRTDSVGDTCWWATGIGRTVKCTSTFTPVGRPVAGELKMLTQELVVFTP